MDHLNYFRPGGYGYLKTAIVERESLIYEGAKIAILGLGITGRAAARYALHRGAQVYVSDSRDENRFLTEESEFLASARVSWEAGGHSRDFLAQAEVLLVSPGVDLRIPLLQQLRENGVRVAGELAVVADQIEVPVIAVTGTNGKTTVTTLIGELLQRSGKRVFVGGNIGTPLYEYLQNPEGIDVVVAEVSSFQLESAGGFSPDVSLLLNISPDHLDRHGSMEHYIQTKMQVFNNMSEGSLAILDGDDASCRTWATTLSVPVQTFGGWSDCTARITGGEIHLQLNGKREAYQFRGLEQKDGISLKNYAAASLAARFLGCSPEDIQAGLESFELLPHRMEFVAEIDRVSYINDSKATNTGAVIAALNQFDSQVILIAGGRDKGDDYCLLKESLAARVKKLLLIGEAAPLIANALTGVVDIAMVESLDEAVQEAAAIALPGEAVLLSPACASFDMFASYGQRGEQFKKAVMALSKLSTKPNERQEL